MGGAGNTGKATPHRKLTLLTQLILTPKLLARIFPSSISIADAYQETSLSSSVLAVLPISDLMLYTSSMLNIPALCGSTSATSQYQHNVQERLEDRITYFVASPPSARHDLLL
ncbi:Hypothetical protein D9617_16g013270 [Elsinoe fawcettii]|nr:Hypothetical protein D9617_16g013270 [Elsinoe fawcettii]